jgi:xylulokinase
MFLGLDLGTSGLKAVLLDRAQEVRASASAPLMVQQPQPLWREQHPAEWWRACVDAIDGVLRAAAVQGIAATQVEAIGLSGQMHGATLLGSRDEVLRPAILWNDGRAHSECAELERRVPASRQITGNLMMPGFTAPKLLWVAQHEPQVFERIAKVLLPKDYLRLRLTGEYASDMSDAAGTLWLDMGRRDWNDELLAATGLSRQQMPSLYEGPTMTGILRAEVAERFGLRRIPVVAGAGDNAAGAIGMGIVRPGQGMLSLGTSGVFCRHRQFSRQPGARCTQLLPCAAAHLAPDVGDVVRRDLPGPHSATHRPGRCAKPARCSRTPWPDRDHADLPPLPEW